MRKILALALLSILIIGCDYEVAITPNAQIPINRDLVGTWEYVPNDEEGLAEFTMLVLRQNDNEYLIIYGKDLGLYLRAYIVELSDLPGLIQLECIGADNKPVDTNNKSIYHLAKYKFKNDNVLELKILNTDIVDKSCKSSKELKTKILENKKNIELFNNPGMFRRVKK